MAQITNPEAVAFVNQKIRVASDKLAQMYYLAKSVSQEWTATGLGTIIAYDNADFVVDGAATDGRHPATGVNVNNLMNRLSELVADMEASGGAKLNTILALSTNPLS